MLRAIVWKEVREQGLIGLTLVVFGAALLAAARALADPPMAGAPPADVIRYLGVGLLATLMLAVTAGMVCGGAVFAAEREAGTMGFLESLPSSRWALWCAKLAAGVGLAVVQSGLLVAIAAALGLLPSIGWAVAIAIGSLLAFAWGVFGSTAARTTLGSIGLAIPVAGVTAILILVPVLLFFQSPGASASIRPLGALLFLGGMFVVPVALSAWIFTAQDRHRAMDAAPSPSVPLTANRHPATAAPLAARRSQRGLVAVVWMTQRQLRVPGLVLSAFAIVFGLGLLAPGAYPVMTWPGLALAAGVLSGVTAFSDEQSRGSARYWGEQRLPVGRVWVVKVALHMLFCLWLLFLLALPLALQAQFGNSDRLARGHTLLTVVFRSLVFDELGRHGWKYLFVPAVYGFAAGHLCGLVFRKTVVACGVAGIVGGAGALAWGPSLLAGGVAHWQLWVPPVIALLTARAIVSAWTTDRLFDRRPFTRLAGGVVATSLAMVAGISYRVLQLPSRPDAEDDVRYVDHLPGLDENLSRREFRAAAERYARAATATNAANSKKTWPVQPRPAGRELRVEERLERSLRFGWPAGDAELDAWVNELHDSSLLPDEQPWQVLARNAAEHPVGIFEYPQLLGFVARDPTLLNAQRMAHALLARGLQQQAAGDPVAFVSALKVSLRLSQTMRNGTIVAAFQTGCEVERVALQALDRWLERLTVPAAQLRMLVGDGPCAWALARATERPDLVRAALELVRAADPREPFDPRPHFLSERYVFREAMKAPTQWLPAFLNPDEPDKINPEVDLVGVAWAVPWERERTRRLLGLGYEAFPTPGAPVVAEMQYLSGRPGARLLQQRRNPQDLIELDRSLRGYRRAGVLKLALCAFKTDCGQYPPALDELVAHRYLPSLPPDPYDETRGFRYRISPAGGETLLATSRVASGVVGLPSTGGQGPAPTDVDSTTSRFVPAGQAILWSVGPDRTDQGGTSLPLSVPGGVTRSDDSVYLVPHPLNPPPRRPATQ